MTIWERIDKISDVLWFAGISIWSAIFLIVLLEFVF